MRISSGLPDGYYSPQDYYPPNDYYRYDWILIQARDPGVNVSDIR